MYYVLMCKNKTLKEYSYTEESSAIQDFRNLQPLSEQIGEITLRVVPQSKMLKRQAYGWVSSANKMKWMQNWHVVNTEFKSLELFPIEKGAFLDGCLDVAIYDQGNSDEYAYCVSSKHQDSTEALEKYMNKRWNVSDVKK